ncbi:MAG TPA: NAD(+)/NADH kinase [Halococcus sp.]|nr:NAD(+)/NADH kinase [Halococcus sp.]
MSHIGVIVNPAAGRDIRRLTGGASVVDNYAKRRVAECVLDGLTVLPDPPDATLMPDTTGIAASVVENAPESVSADVLDFSPTESAADTRQAAERFRESADALVVLGGDGTTRDAALKSGDLPILSVSTGTNNVVPSAVDGTVAGAAAALVGTGEIDIGEVTYRHEMVEARTESGSVTGLAAVELSDRSFIGTRALLDPDELLGGIVSRANPAAIGLGGVAGALGSLAPDEPGAIALRLTDADTAARTVSAIVAPGVTTQLGIEEYRRLAADESMTVEVSDGVVGADGERELELTDETVEFRSVPEGPRLVSFEAVFERAARSGVLENGC